jgi:hypothetical protein
MGFELCNEILYSVLMGSLLTNIICYPINFLAIFHVFFTACERTGMQHDFVMNHILRNVTKLINLPE